MIEAKDLTKRFGERLAVDNVSFVARKGEVVGLLGPNGAGKTTTMRMLTGFVPPTEGTAAIAGHDVIDDSMEARRAVGYLPERVPLYPDMTVSAYVAFWGRLRGLKNADSAAADALKRVGLYERRKSLVRTLSKGMKQRLGLAQALVHNPPVIILDEPTIGIDPQQVIEVRQSVRDLGKEHTVLFSTHILSEAEQVCDRVLIIDKGRIVAQGKPAELRKKLQPGMTLYVSLGGADRNRARDLLRGVAGVESVEADGDGFIVRAGSGSDIRAAVSEAVSKAGFALLEMRPLTSSLESIFLEVVGKDGQTA